MAVDNVKEYPSPDNWNLWSKVYSDRDMRLKLYCRDPEERTPCTSNTLVVRNIHLEAQPRSVVELFAKFGPIESSGFPAIQRHYQSRYCFIKFQEIRDAVRACNYYNGFTLRGRILQVVHYDSAYKYCKFAERSKNVQLKKENIVGYVRQAHLQAEFRATKGRPKQQQQNSGPKSVNGQNQDESNCGTSSGMSAANRNDIETNYSGDKDAWPDNLGNVNDISYESPIDDEEENLIKKHVKSVDDVGLESDESFWDWLHGKLKFTGPLHYTHPDIARALHKLPHSVRRQFDWLLGSLRVADQFALIGPYVCLSEQSYWAKEMCIVARLDYRMQFKDLWEPMHPNEIKNDKQLIKYVRAMLVQFGPLSVVDNKITLLLRSLSEPLRGDPTFSPDGLCRMLEANSSFVVDKDVYYLVREHDHLLGRARVQSWRTDDTVGLDDVEGKDSGCGMSTKSSGDTFL